MLMLSVPFDAALSIGHTTITLPKIFLLTMCAALAARKGLAFRELAATPIFLASCLLIAATAVTMFGAQYHGAVLRETAKAMLYLLALCVGYWCYRQDPDQASFVVSVTLVTGFVSLAALRQEWTGAPSVFRSDYGLVPRIAGPLEGPNQLAGFLDITLSWILAQALVERRRSRITWCILALGYVALFLTFSRGGIFASSFTAFTAILLTQSLLDINAIVWYLFSVCGLVVDLLLSHGGAHLFSVSDTGDTGALGHRSDLWRAAIFFWKEHPVFGIGAGNYERELALAGYPKLHDHANSLYLQALAEGGLVLFMSVLAVFGSIFYTLARTARSSALAAGALAATCAFALHQSVDFLEFYPKVATLWWILIGVAVSEHMGNAACASKQRP